MPMPEAPAGTKTLIVEASYGATRQLWVFDAERTWRPPLTALHEDADLVVYAYPYSPEDLQVTEGLHRVPEVDGRPLPTSTWTAKWHRERELGWLADSPPRAPPPTTWLPRFTGAACWSQGGCLTDPEDTGTATQCSLPCTPPVPAAPGVPRPANRPDWGLEPTSDPFGRPIYAPQIPAPMACPDGEWQPLGAAVCTAQTECAEGWPAPPQDASRALYVDLAAPAGGDGTFARPYVSLSQALAHSLPGDALLLGEGTFPVEDTTLDGRTIVGLCPTETTLVTTGADSWRVQGTDARIRGVRLPSTIASGDNFGFQDVAWLDTPQDALRIAAGSSAVIERASVRESAGSGFVVLANAALRASAVVIEGVAKDGFRCGNGERVELEGVAVRDLRGQDMSTGLEVVGCEATVDGMLVEDGLGFGISALAGAKVEALDVTVRDMSRPGLITQDLDTEIVARGVLLDRLGATSLRARIGSAIHVQDAVIRDQAPNIERSLVLAEDDAQISLSRAYLRARSTLALFSLVLARSLVATDVTIDAETATLPVPHVALLQGVRAQLDRVALSIEAGNGIETTTGNWTSVQLTDVSIRGGDVSVSIRPSIEFVAQRLTVSSPRLTGLVLGRADSPSGDPMLLVSDLVARGSEQGVGVEVHGRSRAQISNFLIEGNTVGARVYAEAQLLLHNGTVRANEVGAAYQSSDRESPETSWLGVRFEGNRAADTAEFE